MEKETIYDKLRTKSHDDLRIILCDIIYTYCQPSFGSMSKHDSDLLLFDSMVKVGLIADNASIYDIMRMLKVTRSKARSLIYEHQLRKIKDEEQQKEQLRRVMKSPLMSSLSKNVCLEVDNPYLVDYIRNELKGLGFVTDGSFHAELVKMSAEAFAALYEKTISDENKREVNRRLIELGVKPDTSIKKILPPLMVGVSKSLAAAAMGKIGEDITDACIDYLENNLDALKESIGDLFNHAD